MVNVKLENAKAQDSKLLNRPYAITAIVSYS